MSDYKKQFEDIQNSINDKKMLKAKLEERRDNLSQEYEQICDDLEELGLTKDELDDTISKLEEEIKEELEKCNKTLS